jgi:hypothetical protein
MASGARRGIGIGDPGEVQLTLGDVLAFGDQLVPVPASKLRSSGAGIGERARGSGGGFAPPTPPAFLACAVASSAARPAASAAVFPAVVSAPGWRQRRRSWRRRLRPSSRR